MRIVHTAQADCEVRIFRDLHELSAFAAMRFAELAVTCVEEQGRFAACLSGGSTPRETFALLAEEPHRSSVPWESVHIFWGDERCVPLKHPDNHFTMTSGLFLEHVGIPASNVHRMRGEAAEPRAAAAEYQAMLEAFFSLSRGGVPRFDHIFLGLGEDGHTASLYPGTPGLEEKSALVVAQYVPQREQFRLTVTLPVLCNGADVVFLAAGETKSHALRSVLQKYDHEQDVPARKVRPVDGRLSWFVDEAASAELTIQGTTLA